ncbi:glycosyltransferase [Thermoanaerobacter siderophilus]|uniref:Glycosyltransferase n=1 Tax=Thermoanaerobacter siderophilus SR4 TaxID=880478 RepID=I9KUV6_9THEO|nr:glycosyltransferase [Thermoanaerobacter siderophilus]EIW00666.1 glycosyltransferase [Thermoanaerobacter siderophilus SR4]
MNRVKVLQIIPNFGYGGAERLTVNLMKYLDKERYEIRAISMFGPLHTELEKILKNENIPVYYLGKKKGFDPRMFFRIDKIIKSFKPHIVHTHRYVLRYVLPSLLLHKVPVKVHTVHNIAEKEVDKVGKLVHKIAFSFGVIPISISRLVSESLTSVYGIKNIPLILNGIPVEYYQKVNISREEWREKEGFQKEDFLFVNIARLAPQKNQALLIEAFAKGPAKHDNSKLIIVGNGEERERLEEITKLHRLEKKVYFLGIRTDIPDILNASDVFVLSSDWEGNPLSVMEAMAAGRPVIATSVGGVPELIQNNITGILVPPKNVNAFSKAMLMLIENKDLCQKLGEKAKEVAEKEFDISVMVKKYEKLYESLLQFKLKKGASLL